MALRSLISILFLLALILPTAAAQIPACPDTASSALPDGSQIVQCWEPPSGDPGSATDTPTPMDTVTLTPTPTFTLPTATATLAQSPTATLITLTPPPTATGTHTANCANTSVGLIPFTEPGGGGLYPDGSNVPPYMTSVNAARAQITPRDTSGNPNASGKMVFLSIGMSNAQQEFAVLQQVTNTDSQKAPSVVLVNGAVGGWDVHRVNDPAQAPSYWAAVDSALAARGVNGQQVQALWLKEAILGTSGYATYREYDDDLEASTVTLLGTIAARYPNLKLVYLESRSYGGYVADAPSNGEPFAWSSGLVVKDLIARQQAGDSALSALPLMLWSWYLWADGTTMRADTWSWPCNYFEGDGLHPSGAGETALAYKLRTWLRSDPTTAWYRP